MPRPVDDAFRRVPPEEDLPAEERVHMPTMTSRYDEGEGGLMVLPCPAAGARAAVRPLENFE
jgi:hypothetical protein